MAPPAAQGRRADGEESRTSYLVLGAEVLQNLLACGTPDLHPGGRRRCGRGLPALLPALSPARGVPFGPGSAPSSAAAPLAASGSLCAPLPHAKGIEIQRLALEGSLHVAEHAAVLLPRDLVCGARPGQVHGQIIFVGAVPASSAGGHGSSATANRRFSFPEAERAATGSVRRATVTGAGGGAWAFAPEAAVLLPFLPVPASQPASTAQGPEQGTLCSPDPLTWVVASVTQTLMRVPGFQVLGCPRKVEILTWRARAHTSARTYTSCSPSKSQISHSRTCFAHTYTQMLL